MGFEPADVFSLGVILLELLTGRGLHPSTVQLNLSRFCH